MITKIILGAALGEILLGKKVGAQGALWGAVAAAIPDLSILLVSVFVADGGGPERPDLSHSLAFAFLLAPLLGWMLARLNHSRRETWFQWGGLAFWAMLGALLLQCFTIDGAPLFEPFSDHRVVLGSFIIVDPLYAMPLLAGLLVALYLARGSRERAFASLAGMGFSLLYLIVTLSNQWQVHSVFQHSLQTQGHDYQQLFIYPMAFNNVRWLGMAEDERGVWVGYYSTQDDFEYVAFQHVDKNERLIAELMEETAAQRLLGLFGARHAPSETPSVITDDELSMPPVQKGSRLIRPERAKEDLS